MKFIANAVREGANAYLYRQLSTVAILIVVLVFILYFTKSNETVFAIGRAGAFVVGAVFSWLVGFVGMRLATTGNLRVAAAGRCGGASAMASRQRRTGT